MFFRLNDTHTVHIDFDLSALDDVKGLTSLTLSDDVVAVLVSVMFLSVFLFLSVVFIRLF